MALITCADCGGQVSTGASACPACGAKVPHFKWWLWIPLSLLSSFFLLGLIISSTPAGQARINERAVIEQCWDRFYDDTVFLTVGAKQLLSDTCKQMEANYRSKWNREP